MQLINAIVSCTQKKRYPPAPKLQMRRIRAESIDSRFEQWRVAVKRPGAMPVQVAELYASDHWFVARELGAIARETEAELQLHVCSAGFGLIGLESFVPPYDCTFAVGGEDAISTQQTSEGRSDDHQRWWALQGEWRPNDTIAARSATQLAKHTPESPLVVAGSFAYIDAMAIDLRNARHELADPELLCIVTTPSASGMGDLDSNTIACSAKLQSVVGGARQSLHIRVARKMLAERKRWPLRASVLAKRYAALTQRQPDVPEYDRQKMDDEAVRGFIREQLAASPALARTPMLRRLRSAGQACEQARFARLYNEVREAMHG